MKKLLVIAVALCVAIMPAMGDSNKDLRKAIKKQRTEKLKEFKKEGWTIFGSTRTLDVALLEHYNRIETLADNAKEVVGVATRCKSKNIGAQMAYNNACITYAQQAGSQLSGRVIADMQGDAVTNETEFEHFYAAYERMVDKEIRGEMTESFSIIRGNDDGTFEIETFFIIDEDAASSARLRALESAMKESDAARKNANRIQAFARERVK